MNMRAELVEARPSTSSRTHQDRRVTWCTYRPLSCSSCSRRSAKRRMVRLPGQSAGSHAAGKPGSTYGMTRQASTHPIQVANACRGSEVGSRHGSVRGQEILMPSSNGGQVPPLPDCALETTVHPRLIGQEDGGRGAYAEIGKDLLHLCL